MAVIGLSLGFLNSFVALFFASCIALIYSLFVIARKKEPLIPFGPFIIIGAMLVVHFTEYINEFLIGLLTI